MKRNDAEERKKQRILAKRRKHAKSGNGTALLDESDEEMDFTDGDDESVDSDEEWAMGVMKGGDWQSKTRGGLGTGRLYGATTSRDVLVICTVI